MVACIKPPFFELPTSRYPELGASRNGGGTDAHGPKNPPDITQMRSHCAQNVVSTKREPLEFPVIPGKTRGFPLAVAVGFEVSPRQSADLLLCQFRLIFR